MVLQRFSRGARSQIEEIEHGLGETFAETSHQFRAAIDALAGLVAPGDVETIMRNREEAIHDRIEVIRRRLIIHAAVRGHEVDLPSLLVYMSITKDIDQIADLARNLLVLAVDGVVMGNECQRIMEAGQEISTLINDTAKALAQWDADAATTHLDHVVEKIADHRAQLIPRAHAQSPEQVVTTCLFHRSVADILTRLANVLASVELPVDQLDHWNRSGWNSAQPRQLKWSVLRSR